MANKEKKSYYFYVLYCKDGTLYAGFTTDLAKRLAVHNDGTGAKYTRVAKRRPARMIYAEQFATKSLAMQAEYRFKQLTRAEKESYLKANGQKSVRSRSLVQVDRVEDIQTSD